MCETLHDRVADSGFARVQGRAAGRHRMRTTCPAGGLRGGGVKRIVLSAVVLTAAFSFACGGADNAGKPSGAAANAAVATPTLALRTSAAAPASTPGTDAAKAATTAAAEPSAAPATPAAEPTPTAVASGGSTPVTQQATTVPATPTAVAPTQAPSLPQTRSVGITEFNQFSPSSVTIAAGGTVDWAWSSSQYHDVTGVDFAGSSKTEKAGSFSMTFPNPGTYRYECQVHASFGMRGTVIVQ